MFVAREICYTLPHAPPSEMPVPDVLWVIKQSCTPTGRVRAPAVLRAAVGNPAVKQQYSN